MCLQTVRYTCHHRLAVQIPDPYNSAPAICKCKKLRDEINSKDKCPNCVRKANRDPAVELAAQREREKKRLSQTENIRAQREKWMMAMLEKKKGGVEAVKDGDGKEEGDKEPKSPTSPGGAGRGKFEGGSWTLGSGSGNESR